MSSREATLAVAVASPTAVPLSLLTDLTPTQWSASFTYLLEAALVLFQSVSRLDVDDVHKVATIGEECENAVEEVKRRIASCFQALKTLLKCGPAEKKVTVEIESLQRWLKAAVDVSSQSILSIEAWRSVRDYVLWKFCEVVKTVGKMMGEQLHCPWFYRVVEEACTQVGSANKAVSTLLTVCLYRIGPLFTDLSEKYLQRFSISEQTLEALRAMASSTDVTLGTAKKMRSRKLGNSHQKRSQKNAMRRDESKKLLEIEKQVVSTSVTSQSPSDTFAHLHCNFHSVLSAYLLYEDIPSLQGWTNVDWTKLQTDIQSIWLEIVVLTAIRRRKQLRVVERILEKTAQVADLAVQSRRAMFLLSRVTGDPDDIVPEAASTPPAEAVKLAIIDPDS